jgi:hypothetical protein
MTAKEQLLHLVSEVNIKLKKILSRVEQSVTKDPLSQISILVNVNEELDDVLLNWEEGFIPDRLLQLFKDQEEFDDEEDDY